MSDYLPYNNKLLKTAKMLRTVMTRQEKHLWYDFLKDYPVKVYKQKIIGSYIVDFYCHKAKLIIELDGNQHYEEKGLKADIERDNFLKSLGLTILRIPNLDIDRKFSDVCSHIEEKINNAISPSQSSLQPTALPGESLEASP